MTTAVAVLSVLVALDLLMTLRLARTLLGRGILVPRFTPRTPLSPGAAAPPFTARSADGELVDSERATGGTFTLVYLSEDCPTCRSALPALGAAAFRAEQAGARLFLVTFREHARTAETMRALLREHGVTTPLLVVPPKHPLGATYNPNRQTPYFCDVRDGTVTSVGSLGSPSWRQTVDAWRPRRPTSPAATGTASPTDR